LPSDEKWQQTTLVVLARAFATSEKPNPGTIFSHESDASKNNKMK